ncbi:MAG: PEP-CTERM sorting domain-containing protein, partial [Planctomycetia bacterium]
FVGTQEWEIDYDRTSAAGLDNFTADYLPVGSFVAITAVPEPSTWVLAAGGLACAAWGAWRRCRRDHGRPCTL